MLAAEIVAVLSFAAWVWLALVQGRFWVVRDESEPVGAPPPRRVIAVIPARNEAATIERAVRSLAGVQVIVVNDHSEDATAQIARSAGATVVDSRPLPAGWTGKMWAVSQGLEVAFGGEPDYVLLTDADVEHAPDGVLALVSRAERDALDLASFMVRLNNEDFAERAMIPAFVFFFLMLYPPRWIASRGRTAGAAGGCMLVRATALKRIGGVSRIRGAIIDDCALAREIKRSGGQLWLGLTTRTRSLRSYASFDEIEDMIARTAFTQLRHSVLLLIGTVAGMMLLFAVPLVWPLMWVLYAPMLRLYGQSPAWAPLLPLVAASYTWATVVSATRYWRGRGGQWKGRAQDQG